MQHSHVVQLHRGLEDIIQDVNDLSFGELDLLLFDVVDEMLQIPILLILCYHGESVVDALHVVPKIDQLRVVLTRVVHRICDVFMRLDLVTVLHRRKGTTRRYLSTLLSVEA